MSSFAIPRARARLRTPRPPSPRDALLLVDLAARLVSVVLLAFAAAQAMADDEPGNAVLYVFVASVTLVGIRREWPRARLALRQVLSGEPATPALPSPTEVFFTLVDVGLMVLMIIVTANYVL